MGHGVADRRPAGLPAQYEALVARDLPVEAEVRARLRTFTADFARCCDDLENRGVPASVQHDDLHMNNVFVRDGRARVLDWGDSCVGHPFASLVVTSRFIEERGGLAADGPWFARLVDAYLEPWGPGHHGTVELALRGSDPMTDEFRTRAGSDPPTTQEEPMARVVMHAVVSVDGFIARPDHSVGPLFDWYGNGDTRAVVRESGWTFQVSQASAEYVQPFWDAVDVTVIGRRLFDLTNGWDGKPGPGRRLVVVTHRPLPQGWLDAHPDAPFETAPSVEAAVGRARELAGDGLVVVTAGDVGGQAFGAGLVDEVAMDVVPAVLGTGVRFFGGHEGTVLLDDPDLVVQGDRVLHLHYTVRQA